MPDYMRLPIGKRCPERVNVVIEIPRDSVNKYEYDKELHVFRSGPHVIFSSPLSRRLWIYSLYARARR